MVSEWEKEELGRLTHQKLKVVAQTNQEPSPGRITRQDLKIMKEGEKSVDAKIKIFFERLRLALSTGIGAMITPASERRKVDPCKEYGHSLKLGSTWKGPFPKCLDCGVDIKDPNELRGAVNREERSKFKSF